jgi:predicted GNAT family acetyltransferase
VQVLPKYRRKGIGIAISTAVILGIIRFKRVPTLFVNEHNIAAIQMYEKIGFEPYNEYIFYKGRKA